MGELRLCSALGDLLGWSIHQFHYTPEMPKKSKFLLPLAKIR
jgi:hypothetical protein